MFLKQIIMDNIIELEFEESKLINGGTTPFQVALTGYAFFCGGFSLGRSAVRYLKNL